MGLCHEKQPRSGEIYVAQLVRAGKSKGDITSRGAATPRRKHRFPCRRSRLTNPRWSFDPSVDALGYRDAAASAAYLGPARKDAWLRSRGSQED